MKNPTPLPVVILNREKDIGVGELVSSPFRKEPALSEAEGETERGFIELYWNFLKTSTELCPPKPNELETAVFTVAFLA